MQILLENYFLQYECEFTCNACEYNIEKLKIEPCKISWKKNFNRLKFAQQKIICMCIDVYETFEGTNFNKNFKVLSEFNKKIL